MQNLQEFFQKIEHLPYDQRKPEHAALYEAKYAFSHLTWDLYSHEASSFFQRTRPLKEKSTLAKRGAYVDRLTPEHCELLKQIFQSCEKVALDPMQFDSDYFYEPRKNVHEHMVRINDYYKPSQFFFDNFPKIINHIINTIEDQCGHFWRVVSMRIFQVKPVEHTQGLHIDGHCPSIKKIFFYPNGVSKDLGSTQIKTKDGEDLIIEGEAGTWVIFENNVVEHQAFSSLKAMPRPTIELDIVPCFQTDPEIFYTDVNSWHPWLPLNPKNNELALSSEEINFKNVYERTLNRIAGFCAINPVENYKLLDLANINPDLENLFEAKLGKTTKTKVEIDPLKNESIKNILKKLIEIHGIRKTFSTSMKLVLRAALKKIKPQKNPNFHNQPASIKLF